MSKEVKNTYKPNVYWEQYQPPRGIIIEDGPNIGDIKLRSRTSYVKEMSEYIQFLLKDYPPMRTKVIKPNPNQMSPTAFLAALKKELKNTDIIIHAIDRGKLIYVARGH